jgi:hypothetical protein
VLPSKRLFVGLELPASCKTTLLSLDPHLTGLRWLTKEQLHLTLSFLGEVEGPAEDRLREALSDATKTPGSALPFLPKGAGQDSVHQQETISGHLPKVQSDRVEARKPSESTQGVEWEGMIAPQTSILSAPPVGRQSLKESQCRTEIHYNLLSMALLFVLWIFARNLLYAALQAAVIWTLAGVLGQALSWILIWQILSVLHFIINFPRILRANDFKFFLPIDVGLFVLGLWQGFFLGSILTGLVGGLIWLTSRWTGYQPDWLALWLGVTSAGVLFCRAQAKRKGVQAWKAAPSASPPEKKLSFGEQPWPTNRRNGQLEKLSD